MNSIKVDVRMVYGNKLVYPMCENARIFASISGTRTLGIRDIINIKKLGFDIEIVTPKLAALA